MRMSNAGRSEARPARARGAPPYWRWAGPQPLRVNFRGREAVAPTGQTERGGGKSLASGESVHYATVACPPRRGEPEGLSSRGILPVHRYGAYMSRSQRLRCGLANWGAVSVAMIARCALAANYRRGAGAVRSSFCVDTLKVGGK